MTDGIPAALRAVDASLYKTATRAVQLQSVKPVIAYWSEYWVVNQILAKQLHSDDPEILEYTMKLMDKLEQTKAEHANDDAVMDDTAGQAYVEQFAQETLDRAQRVVKANKVTAQTANTFDAASGFLGLVQIWGSLDTETQQKIKYAKWNAARIIKAIKQGEDPNESNPKPDELAPQEPALDPADPEVRMLAEPGAGAPGESGPGPKPVSLEDAPDSDLPNNAADISLLPQSPTSAVTPHPPAQDELVLPSAPPSAPGIFDAHGPPSPISPPSHDLLSHQPAAPPPADARTPTPPPETSGSAFPPPSASGADKSAVLPPTFSTSPQSTPAIAPPPISPNPDCSFINITPTANVPARPVIPQPSAAVSAPVSVPAPRQAAAVGYTADDQAMTQAQKHAKWAISALNFEDVPTAVRELRRALEALGAS